jgi:hypothetical protein
MLTPRPRAQREQIAVPRKKSIHRARDRDGMDLIVGRIPADAGNLDRRHHLGDRLEPDRISAIDLRSGALAGMPTNSAAAR